jgi:muramoyltetrapeptide carboxypeptidase
MPIPVHISGNAIDRVRRIRIIAPASRPEPAAIDACRERLVREGFEVEVDERCFLDAGWTAGPDDQRLAALSDALRDPGVDCILCARGGFGSPRIADDAHSPRGRVGAARVIIGYSDISFLLARAMRLRGVIPVHGPLAGEFANPAKAEAVEQLVRLLKGEDLSQLLADRLREGLQVIRPGRIEGPLAGGNLTSIQLLAGTRSAQALKDHVLFLEDAGERMYELDRALDHLRRAGMISAARGLLIGAMTPKAEDAGFSEATLLETLARLCDRVDRPGYAGLPCGHGADNVPIVVGARVSIG